VRTLVGLIVVLAAACTTQPVSPTVGPSASASAAAAAPTLPVERFERGESQGTGFLDVATGQFARDPNADMVTVNNQQSALQRTQTQPYLYGAVGRYGGTAGFSGFVTYDAPLHRWVPVGRSHLTPDGLSYAYAEWFYPPVSQTPHPGTGPDPIGGRIHVTTVSSGLDRVVYSYTGWPGYEVVGLSSRYAYLAGECNGDYPGCNQLWQLDLATSQLARVTEQTGQWWVIDRGVVWTEAVDFSRLIRIDVAGGGASTWLSRPFSDSMELIGVDASGSPWVSLGSPSPSPLLRVVAPERTQKIFAATGPYSSLVVDPRGTWFAVVDNQSPTPGLYLFTKDGGVKAVSDLPVLPV